MGYVSLHLLVLPLCPISLPLRAASQLWWRHKPVLATSRRRCVNASRALITTQESPVRWERDVTFRQPSANWWHVEIKVKNVKSDSRSFQAPGAVCEALGYGRLACEPSTSAGRRACSWCQAFIKGKKTAAVCCVLFAKPGNHSEKRQAAWQGEAGDARLAAGPFGVLVPSPPGSGGLGPASAPSGEFQTPSICPHRCPEHRAPARCGHTSERPQARTRRRGASA